MNRWIPVLLCLLLPSGAAAGGNWADDIARTGWLESRHVDWDGTLSRTEVRIANLPALEAAEDLRLTLRLGLPWFAPNCVNSQKFPARRPRTAGRLHPPLVIRKSNDKASPLLLNAERTRRLLRLVVIRTRDSRRNEVLLVLRNVRVDCFTTFDPGIVPGEGLEEFVVLDYAVLYVLRARRHSGPPETPFRTRWVEAFLAESAPSRR